MKPQITIATRGSQLAMWQAKYVSSLLEDLGFITELNVIKTQGDKILHKPLYDVGGKGLFVKELEQAMLNGEADIAVHSLKDVPAQLPDGFVLPAILERHNEHDVLVLQDQYRGLINKSPGRTIKPDTWLKLSEMTIGTSSLRRSHILKMVNPTIKTKSLRGNVDTRLGKLTEGKEFDGIILAAASLERLQLTEQYSYFKLSAQEFVPSAGQGALALECREDFAHRETLAKLSCPQTSLAVEWERGVMRSIGASCQTPVGCLVAHRTREWFFNFRLITPDSQQIYFQKKAKQLDKELAKLVLEELSSGQAKEALAACGLKLNPTFPFIS